MFYGYRKVPGQYPGTPRAARGRRKKGDALIMLIVLRVVVFVRVAGMPPSTTGKDARRYVPAVEPGV
jgi:hypothetical protein